MSRCAPILLTVLAALFLSHPALRGAAPPAPARLASLASLFDLRSGAVRDTNGDGLADAVAARVIVPARPAAEEVEAAANLAARIGFETTALSLPIVLRDDEVREPASLSLPILVGRENRFVRALADTHTVDLESLTPGQGLIAIVESPLGGADGLLVAGKDAAGTLAAAMELAARLPRLWNMTGATLDAVEGQSRRWLEQNGARVSQAAVRSVLVDSDRRGLATINVEAHVAPPDGSRALRALEALDLAHRRGNESRVLDFAEAASTTVSIVAGGKRAGQARVARSGLNSRTLTPPVDPDEFAPETPAPASGGSQAPLGPPPFDLASTYSLEGWFGDAYSDLIPDRTETSLILGDARESYSAVHVAARLGLESTGVSLPLTRPADKVREPARETNPILFGARNKLVQDLIKIGKARLDDLRPGEGVVQIVPRAFGNVTATVVAGADEAGADAAGFYLARRMPYLWETRRGSFTMDDLKTETTRFFAAQSVAGQASQAVRELDDILDGLREKTIQSLEVKLFLEKPDEKLAGYLAAGAKERLKDAAVKVTTQAVTDPVTVFEEKQQFDWEVDDFRARVTKDVLPRVAKGSTVEVEARLSETPEVRRALEDEMARRLREAGAATARVRVLSAYKQGFFWLTEQVIPDLRGKSVRRVHVAVKAHKPDLSKKHKFFMVPSRWLQELFPVDEVFERDLRLPKEAFSLELADEAQETYTLEAFDGGGRTVHRASFSPKIVEREYLDKFPGWSRVEVTTGWITARVDGKDAIDARIETDPERFWDYYQAKVLPRVYDNTMKVTGSKPTADKQPFHRDLDVEVWMSEPDFRLGIDEEQVSSLEALHEDIYFVTLDFFAALGRTVARARINAPGLVLPIIHPSRPGKGGESRIRYAGNASTKAKIEVTYREKEEGAAKAAVGTAASTKGADKAAAAGGEEKAKAEGKVQAEEKAKAGEKTRPADPAAQKAAAEAAGAGAEARAAKGGADAEEKPAAKPNLITRDLAKIEVSNLTAIRAVVRANGVSEIELQVEAKDDREAGRAADALDNLARLHAAGLFRGALSYDHVGRIAVSIALRDARTRREVRHTGESQPSRIRAASTKPVLPIVAWDHIVSPDEAEEIVGRLAAFPEVQAYRVGTSYRGRDLSVAEITLPTGSDLVSTAKLSAGKPTIFLMGRQHANEVSSTSHILRLGELLVTDPDYRRILEKVNVVICPVMNPDGAQIAFDLQKLTPTHMLHAGRYSALGMEISSRANNLLPEAEVEGRIWREWLPDIYLNPHGYPSHEWVQPFSGYVPPGFRAYWGSRGWYTLMSSLRDPRFPQYLEATNAIREAIVGEINAVADVRAMNLRHQARYIRWAHGFGPHVYGMEIYKDTTIFYTDPESGEVRGGRRVPAAPSGGNTRRVSMSAWPHVTLVGGTTEAPDETAQGPWFNLVTRAGFAFLMAHVNYLKDGQYTVERIEENSGRDGSTLTILRVRPVMPPKMPARRVTTN